MSLMQKFEEKKEELIKEIGKHHEYLPYKVISDISWTLALYLVPLEETSYEFANIGGNKKEDEE